jgi:hypothetical protein
LNVLAGVLLGRPERKARMNKRTFDLIVAVTVGVIAAETGFRLWATRYLIEGKPEGALNMVAQLTKAVTG